MGRISGHMKGAEAVTVTVKACRELSIEYLTLYAFSTENWLRPQAEVSGLMKLLSSYLKSELPALLENDIRLTTIGNIDHFDPELCKQLEEAKTRTAANKSMTLNLALSYGSQDEIVKAVRRIAHEVADDLIKPEEITRDIFARYLDTASMPDPDLLIRTSGEYRLSNFLLWQLAYTEFYFIDVLWPDFTRDNLLQAIADYQKRQRRFGLTGNQLSSRD